MHSKCVPFFEISFFVILVLVQTYRNIVTCNLTYIVRCVVYCNKIPSIFVVYVGIITKKINVHQFHPLNGPTFIVTNVICSLCLFSILVFQVEGLCA